MHITEIPTAPLPRRSARRQPRRSTQRRRRRPSRRSNRLELIDSVPWKWWAKYQKFDEQNAKVEVVDLFHFLVSLAQTLGMTPDDVYQAYLKKNAVNHLRQESGYAKKDEADSKHI